MEKARILIVGKEVVPVEEVCRQIIEVTEKLGTKHRGPIPLPTKRLKVMTLKSPDGEGTNTWDRWEMRLHKRVIDISADERSLRQIMRVRVPDSVNIEIEMIS